MASGKHAAKWREIVNYCQAHAGHFSPAQSKQLAAYATEAETYFDEVKQTGMSGILSRQAIRDRVPATSVVLNLLLAGNGKLNRQLAAISLSELLPRITKPTLVLGGAYDFICPQELGEEVFARVGTTAKRQVVSPVSGHLIMQQDEELFCREVSRFVEQYQ
jgi:pimeloyl-ACP methyl ester carboxylesterase